MRWPSLSPEGASPVFVYTASGEEESLTGSCLARCKELPDCMAVAVAYTGGNCYGVANTKKTHFRTNLDIVYFKKTCLKRNYIYYLLFIFNFSQRLCLESLHFKGYFSEGRDVREKIDSKNLKNTGNSWFRSEDWRSVGM